VRETSEEVRVLQDLLDRSDANAGDHLRLIFDARSRVTADELVSTLDGIFEIHLAALTATGAPVVAPIDALLLHGKIYFSVASTAVRSRLLRRDPRVSASYTDGSFALIAHGTAIEVAPDSGDARELLDVAKDLYVAMYGEGWLTFHEHRQREAGRDWSGWIEPRVMFAKR
jgi:uncharacterized pyridoxamine 5'-phosphate oxidase family protein